MPPPLSLVFVAVAEAERAVFFARIQSRVARRRSCSLHRGVDADRKRRVIHFQVMIR